MQHQFSLTLIHRQVSSSVVDQRASDGYVNATALCKAAGKQFTHYKENDNTKAFLAALSSKTGIPVVKEKQSLIESRPGAPDTGGGSWVHPQVAINLGQWLSPEFAVQVSEWVVEWMSGTTPAPSKGTSLPPHLHRYLANDSKIPHDHFSILQETALGLIGPLHMVGFDVPKGWVPDISVGRTFCAHLRDSRGINTDALPTYWHDYLDGRPPVSAKLYPIDLLPTYRNWFHHDWLPTNGVAYFKKKDKNSLAFLDKMPALAAPTKPTAKPLPWHPANG